MTRKRFKVLTTAFLLTLIAFGVLLILIRDKVTHANFDQIAAGMTLDEVRALLGRGHDCVWQTKGLVTPEGFVMAPDPESQQMTNCRDYSVYQWEGTELTILVVVDEEKVAYHYKGSGRMPWYMQWFRGS